jgi:DNA-binding NtrC family response regulator
MAEKGPVVLLVDDERRILSALQRTLRREGYSIETAESAEAALAILEARPVDVVVSDYKMVGVSGTQLLARVRRRWPSTGRILLSGWSREIPEADLVAADPDQVHAKPWDDVALKRALADAIDPRRRRKSSRGG